MENMDKGLMGSDKSAQNTQIVCLSPKVLDFDEKRLHWASVVRVYKENFLESWNPLIFEL